MTLQELLNSLSGDTEVGIWDIRYPNNRHPRKYGKQPTRQTYCKVKNLRYGDIYELLRLDVMGVCIYKDGLLIRVYDEAKTKKSLEQYDLVDKFVKRFRNEVSE